MQANPDKFQAIAWGKKSKDHCLIFNVNGSSISCDDDVKPLRVTIGFRLKFDIRVSNIGKKASRQLNVLKRIGKHLCKLGKLNITTLI